jgi:hypothetical protein
MEPPGISERDRQRYNENPSATKRLKTWPSELAGRIELVLGDVNSTEIHGGLQT